MTREGIRGNPRMCHYCHRRYPRDVLTKDHIVPKSKGGATDVRNYVLACPACQRLKNSQWPMCRCTICTDAVVFHLETLEKTVTRSKKWPLLQQAMPMFEAYGIEVPEDLILWCKAHSLTHGPLPKNLRAV